MNRQREFYYYAEQVTKRTGVGLRKMQSQDRHREIAEARYCLIYLMRHKMKLTLMEIAKLMCRHYSTVHHGLEVMHILQVTMKKYTWLKEIIVKPICIPFRRFSLATVKRIIPRCQSNNVFQFQSCCSSKFL